MTLKSSADAIRAHIIERHIRPAQSRGKTHVELRAGDIHRELGLRSRMPAVCSAMEGRKFLDQAGVSVSERRGPKHGSNVYVTYELAPSERSLTISQKQPTSKSWRAGKDPCSNNISALPADSIDLRRALVLVSCTKQKRSVPCRARELYTSTFFRLVRQLVERRDADWQILSAKYGLLNPDARIEPYELTLNSMPVARRRAWADQLLFELLPLASNYDRVVFFAGQKYREFLAPALESKGIHCDAPMAHLRQGEQLSWLGER